VVEVEKKKKKKKHSIGDPSEHSSKKARTTVDQD